MFKARKIQNIHWYILLLFLNFIDDTGCGNAAISAINEAMAGKKKMLYCRVWH